MYKKLLKPILFCIDPERVHEITFFFINLIFKIPFVSSLISKIFIMIGSLLGILSLIGEKYAQSLANFLGIGRAADLFLYLSLVTIFLFISYIIKQIQYLYLKL